MKRVISCLLVIFAAAFGYAGRLEAVPMTAVIGDFSWSKTVLDFETIAQNEEITNQFSGLGATFSGGIFGDTFVGPFFLGSGVAASNFQSFGFTGIFNPLTVAFGSPITILGFDAVTNDPDDITIRTFLGAMQTGSFLFGTSLTPSFLGVKDLAGIDRIEIEGTIVANGAFVLDNFRFEGVAAVPEPATLLLLGTGLAGLALVARKKKA